MLMSALQQQLNQECSSMGTASAWLQERSITVEAFESEASECDVNFVEMGNFLKTKWNIHRIDVSAGPTLISLMMKAYVL